MNIFGNTLADLILMTIASAVFLPALFVSLLAIKGRYNRWLRWYTGFITATVYLHVITGFDFQPPGVLARQVGGFLASATVVLVLLVIILALMKAKEIIEAKPKKPSEDVQNG